MEAEGEDGGGMSKVISPLQLNFTFIILSIVCLVGIVGNALVIFVYYQKNDKQTATLFILVLASADFVACLIIVPFTLYLEAVFWKMGVDFLCKAYFVMNATSTIFGSVIISAIAVDRYLCICHPFSRILSVARARLMISILAGLSFLLGCAPLSTVAVMRVNDSYHCIDEEFVSDGSDAMNLNDSMGSNATSSWSWRQIVNQVGHKTHSITYLLCILTVTILYLRIFLSVRRVRQKKQTLKGIRLKRTDSSNVGTSSSNRGGNSFVAKFRRFHRKGSRLARSGEGEEAELEAIRSDPSNGGGAGAGGGGGDAIVEKPPIDGNKTVSIAYDQETGEAATTAAPTASNGAENAAAAAAAATQTRRISMRFIKDTQVFQNFRTAAMLFIVAIIYIITFLPASLMAYKFVDFNLAVFYLYFLNNAANPVVYSFLNQNFREDVRTLLGRSRRYRDRRGLTTQSVFSR